MSTPLLSSLLRVGVVGAGQRGHRFAATLATHPDVDLIGVSDAVLERAAHCAEPLGAGVFTSASELLTVCDAVCIAVPTRDHALLARTAVAEGTHVFLAWPPTTGLDEAESLAHRAEEAGVEVGVARPFPVAGLLGARPGSWRPRLIALHLAAGPAPDGEPVLSDLSGLSWPHRLAGAADLCLALAQTRDIQRVEAEADRGSGAHLHAVAFSLRFRNGTYAQAVLREDTRRPGPDERFRLDASGQGLRISARSFDGPLCVERQTQAPDGITEHPLAPSSPEGELARFMDALIAGRPAPVSILDGLHTMRLVEQLMARLR